MTPRERAAAVVRQLAAEASLNDTALSAKQRAEDVFALAIREAEDAAYERAAMRILPKSRMIDSVEAAVATNCAAAIRALKGVVPPAPAG
jgi:hypothetical protein